MPISTMLTGQSLRNKNPAPMQNPSPRHHGHQEPLVCFDFLVVLGALVVKRPGVI
jgi:hypothetical protein